MIWYDMYHCQEFKITKYFHHLKNILGLLKNSISISSV